MELCRVHGYYAALMELFWSGAFPTVLWSCHSTVTDAARYSREKLGWLLLSYKEKREIVSRRG